MTRAGKNDRVLAFSKREIAGNDGHGNSVTDWSEQFRERGERVFLRGGEEIQAARLEGRQPVVFKIWTSVDARSVAFDWRIQDVNSGETYNVKTVEESKDGMRIEILAESGGRDG